jgi:hypothetical protein
MTKQRRTGGDTRAAAAANGKRVGRPAHDAGVVRQTFSFSLPSTLIDWADDEARRTGESRSALVERALKALRSQS